MKPEEVLTALETYHEELVGIVSRFRHDRDGIHITSDDDERFRQIGHELIDLMQDEFVDGNTARQTAHLLNDSVSNMTGTPSLHGVQQVKGAVAAAITRVKRNPNSLRSNATMEPAPKNSENAMAILERIANRLHLVAKQLRVRHAQRPTLDVGDEYDLQDLMHSLLRLYFDDVRPEEWAPSYAGASSRMDFLLPVNTTVIETKMVRPSLTTRHLGEELIVDIAKYERHPSCEMLLCVVYDPEHRITNPRGIENDLSGQRGKLSVRVIIVPR